MKQKPTTPRLAFGQKNGPQRLAQEPTHRFRFGGALLTVMTVAGIWAAWILVLRPEHLSKTDSTLVLAHPLSAVALPNVVTSHPHGRLTNSAPTKPASEKDNGLVERINRANQLLSQGKPADALTLLQEAAKLSPDDEDVHYNLGIALARLNRNEEALKEYQEALRLFLDYAEVHNNLGNLLVRMGKKEEAVEQFEQAIKISPEYASAWNNFGSVLQQLGRTDEAHSHFEKAVQLDTNYWQAHYNLATSYLQRKQYAQARAGFETVARLQPDFAPVKEALARMQQASPIGPVSP